MQSAIPFLYIICIYYTCPTFDSKHPMAKIFEVDLPMSVRIQVPGQLLHLQDK